MYNSNVHEVNEVAQMILLRLEIFGRNLKLKSSINILFDEGYTYMYMYLPQLLVYFNEEVHVLVSSLHLMFE